MNGLIKITSIERAKYLKAFIEYKNDEYEQFIAEELYSEKMSKLTPEQQALFSQYDTLQKDFDEMCEAHELSRVEIGEDYELLKLVSQSSAAANLGHVALSEMTFYDALEHLADRGRMVNVHDFSTGWVGYSCPFCGSRQVEHIRVFAPSANVGAKSGAVDKTAKLETAEVSCSECLQDFTIMNVNSKKI